MVLEIHNLELIGAELSSELNHLALAGSSAWCALPRSRICTPPSSLANRCRGAAWPSFR